MGKSKDKGAAATKKNPKEELLAAAGGAAEGDKKGKWRASVRACGLDRPSVPGAFGWASGGVGGRSAD